MFDPSPRTLAEERPLTPLRGGWQWSLPGGGDPCKDSPRMRERVGHTKGVCASWFSGLSTAWQDLKSSFWDLPGLSSQLLFQIFTILFKLFTLSRSSSCSVLAHDHGVNHPKALIGLGHSLQTEQSHNTEAPHKQPLQLDILSYSKHQSIKATCQSLNILCSSLLLHLYSSLFIMLESPD